jgi:hypothetical protein
MTSPIPGDAFASGEAKCAQCGQPAVYAEPHETLCVNCGGYFMVDLDDEGYQKPSTEAQYRSEGKTMDEVLRNDPTWIPTDEELMKDITIVSVLVTSGGRSVSGTRDFDSLDKAEQAVDSIADEVFKAIRAKLAEEAQ